MVAKNKARKMKRKIYLTAITITVLFAIICMASGCKKEAGPSCGTCDYCEHYSHNDSTFTIPGNQFCDEAYETTSRTEHFWCDTVNLDWTGHNGTPTNIHSFYNCTK
jgi:hypothetical protein